MKTLLALALPAVLALHVPAYAREDAPTPQQQEELRRARDEVKRAREELRRAAEELARVSREVDRDSPRAKAWEYMADPKRAMLGVTVDEGPEKNGEVRGVLVTGITPGGGAQKAGLKSGDILLAANGRSLAAKEGEKPGPTRKLKDVMSQLKAGDEVKVDYEREGKRHSVTVVASRQDSLVSRMFDWDEDIDVLVPPMAMMMPVPPMPPEPPMAVHVERVGAPSGLQLARLDKDLAGYFRSDKGVLVLKAPEQGDLGLKGGDVITAVGGKPVDSPVGVWERLEELGRGEKVKMEVVRHGKAQKLEGTLPGHSRRMVRRIEIHEREGSEDGDAP